MAFRDYCSELTGTIPRLPYPAAMTMVNRAWKTVTEWRLWSWRLNLADITAPAIISGQGTCNVTQGSTTVNLDATAVTALSAVALATPPLASATLGQGRQFRNSNTTPNGPLYNITAFDSVGATLTLDRPYADVTANTQLFQVYKCYYAAPSTDFLRYLTVTNMASGYTIKARKLYFDQMKLNSLDPQRGANGDAYIIAEFRVDSNGNPVTEWYPHPTNARIYNCLYLRRFTPLSDSQDVPNNFDPAVIIHLASIYAAEWAMANAANFPELSGTNWVMFAQQKYSSLKDARIQAIKEDDEVFPWRPFLQGYTPDFPLGGEFLQSHDISNLVGGI